MLTNRRIYEIVEVAAGGDTASRAFDLFMMVLVFLNVGVVMLETVKSLEDRFGTWFSRFDIFCVAVFTVEYVLRLWSSTADLR
jgi:voltage-gated potassium channel